MSTRTLPLAVGLTALLLLAVWIGQRQADPAEADKRQLLLPPACANECAAPFGAALGTTPTGLVAYSNCRPHCVLPVPNRWEGTYTGIRWQCVELARRWLIARRGLTFGDVDLAIDIWTDIDHYRDLESGQLRPVLSVPNGAAEPPAVGNLLIYAKVFEGTGHVAVVTDVTLPEGARAGSLEVAEQNYANRPWRDDHARRIPLLRVDGRWWLLDPYLIGWKRLAQVSGSGAELRAVDDAGRH
jgi:hypothetical protein